MITLRRAEFGTYRIVAEDGRDVLVQTDTDFPGVASTFGWSVHNVPRSTRDSQRYALPLPCMHDGTDGTIDCDGCTAESSDFIASAGQWLDDHDGETADDPGYFEATTTCACCGADTETDDWSDSHYCGECGMNHAFPGVHPVAQP